MNLAEAAPGGEGIVREYVGRLAPSPTGFLHLGHAATFLAAGQRADAAGGHLLLRIDDLDGQRSREVFVEAARDDLAWLGLRWRAEWRQRDRLHRYRAAMERLVLSGEVYPCRCSRKDLEQALAAPHEDGEEPLYPGHCRPADSPRDPGILRLLPGTNYRFRVPEGEQVRFVDEACGDQCISAGSDFGDFVVWRRDGLPSYQLATVVDDAEMNVTEIVRGRDLLRSTARQLLLQRALGYAHPAYCHVPLLLDAEGQRLAKRNDSLSLRTLRDQGVTPAEIRSRVEAATHHSVL